MKQQLLTSCGVSSFVATVLMGVFANLPFLLAPGKEEAEEE